MGSGPLLQSPLSTYTQGLNGIQPRCAETESRRLIFRLMLTVSPTLSPLAMLSPGLQLPLSTAVILNYTAASLLASLIGGQQGPTGEQQKSSGIVGSIFRSTVCYSQLLCRALETSLEYFPQKKKFTMYWQQQQNMPDSTYTVKHIHGAHILSILCIWAIGLPGSANKNIGHPAKFEFQISK